MEATKNTVVTYNLTLTESEMNAVWFAVGKLSPACVTQDGVNNDYPTLTNNEYIAFYRKLSALTGLK